MGQNVSSKYNWTYCVHLEVKSTYEYYCEFKGILCIVPEYVNTRILYSIENDYTNDQSFEILRKHLMHYKIYIYMYISYETSSVFPIATAACRKRMNS